MKKNQKNSTLCKIPHFMSINPVLWVHCCPYLPVAMCLCLLPSLPHSPWGFACLLSGPHRSWAVLCSKLFSTKSSSQRRGKRSTEPQSPPLGISRLSSGAGSRDWAEVWSLHFHEVHSGGRKEQLSSEGLCPSSSSCEVLPGPCVVPGPL